MSDTNDFVAIDENMSKAISNNISVAEETAPAVETETATEKVQPYDTKGLTDDNYYSDWANTQFMSVSQFKDFAGTLMHKGCEYTAYDKLTGALSEPSSTALLVGSYVDSYFEGTLDKFIEEHPEIISKSGATKGQLKADFKGAELIINRIEADPLFSKFMSGDKQVIMTGNLFGVDWKIKMDSFFPDEKIVDLKVMKDMKPIWSDVEFHKVDFIRYWGYDIQGAIYQKIVEINTGKKLPFYIACATKEKVTDIEVIEITQEYLDKALTFVEENIAHVLNVKNGTTPPEMCGECSHCRLAKTLKEPITIDQIIPYTPRYAEDDSDEEVPAHGYTLFE